MRIILIAYCLLAATLFLAGPAYASCTTHMYLINGRITTCMTCCSGTGFCTTTCS